MHHARGVQLVAYTTKRSKVWRWLHSGCSARPSSLACQRNRHLCVSCLGPTCVPALALDRYGRVREPGFRVQRRSTNWQYQEFQSFCDW